MRHRQRAGLVVIAMALVLVAIVTGLRPHQVAGTGQAAPVPGPPVAGDCVLDPVPDPPIETTAVTATSGGTVPVYPMQQIRPCTGARYGEITSVIAAPKPTTVEGDGDYRYLNDPNRDSCIPATVQYLGMTMQRIYRFWQPSPQVSLALSRPSSRQQAAGQHWVACIVTLQLPQPTQATATAPASSASRYGSSIRNALTTGQQRDQVSTCIPALDWNGDRAGSCSQPHALEILAYGESGDRPVTRVQIEQTCQQLVRQLTAMPDPTAAGALSIQIRIEDNSNGAIAASPVAAHSSLICGIAATGDRKLGGSLLALGRQPIPWA